MLPGQISATTYTTKYGNRKTAVIVIRPSVLWFLGNEIIHDIICIYGKMVSLAEIGRKLAYKQGMQGMNLLLDNIIRQFQVVIGNEVSFR